jgi:PST family polysaccharide transporter
LPRRLSPSLIQDVIALYGAQAAGFLFPLLTLPYLARVLGPQGWGLVAFTQACSGYLAMVVEYGFQLSATREAARWRHDPQRLGTLLAGVLGAKLALAGACLLVALVLQRQLGNFRQAPLLFWCGMFAAFAQSFNLLWYFQGLERIRFAAALDVVGKALAAASVFALVRHAGDAWKVFAAQGLAATLSLAVCLAVACRLTPPRRISPAGVAQALRMGWSLFVFRGAVSLYTIGNAFLLGLFAPLPIVGYYAGAEKIGKACVAGFQPLNQALYPRLSRLAREAPREAARLSGLALKIMGLGGALLSFGLLAAAPWLVRLLFGEAPLPAVQVLRIFSLLPFLIALSNVLGLQWMLSLGLDGAFNRIIAAAGAVNVSLALLLAARYAHLGMAAAVVAAEAFVTVAIVAVLRLRRLDPLTCLAATGAESR